MTKFCFNTIYFNTIFYKNNFLFLNHINYFKNLINFELLNNFFITNNLIIRNINLLNKNTINSQLKLFPSSYLLLKKIKKFNNVIKFSKFNFKNFMKYNKMLKFLKITKKFFIKPLNIFKFKQFSHNFFKFYELVLSRNWYFLIGKFNLFSQTIINNKKLHKKNSLKLKKKKLFRKFFLKTPKRSLIKKIFYKFFYNNKIFLNNIKWKLTFRFNKRYLNSVNPYLFTKTPIFLKFNEYFLSTHTLSLYKNYHKLFKILKKIKNIKKTRFYFFKNLKKKNHKNKKFLFSPSAKFFKRNINFNFTKSKKSHKVFKFLKKKKKNFNLLFRIFKFFFLKMRLTGKFNLFFFKKKKYKKQMLLSNFKNLYKTKKNSLTSKIKVVFIKIFKYNKSNKFSLNLLNKKLHPFFNKSLLFNLNDTQFLKDFSNFELFSQDPQYLIDGLRTRIFFFSENKLNFSFNQQGFAYLTDFYNIYEFSKNNSIIFKKNVYSFTQKNDFKHFILKKYLKTNYFDYFNEPETTHSFVEYNQIFNKKLELSNYIHDDNFLFIKNLKNKTFYFDEDSSNFDFIIKRIKFKPGYMNIWREVRSVLKFSLNLKFHYQRNLTRYLIKFKKLVRLKTFLIFELNLLNVLVKSKFFPEYQHAFLFLKNNLVYVNGFICNNKFFNLFIGDIVQLVVSFKYYTLHKWFLNWILKKKNKLKSISQRKTLALNNDDEKQKSNNLTNWISFNKNAFTDVCKYIEIDYFSLSFILVYEPFIWLDINPYDILNIKYNIFNIYNWKYIT